MAVIKATKAFLLIEGETVGQDLAKRLKRLFPECTVSFAPTMEEAREALTQQAFHAAFVELRLGETDSITLLRDMHYAQTTTPFVGIVPRALWGMAQDVVRYGVVDLLERNAFDDFALRKAVLFACCRESGELERFHGATRDKLTGLVNHQMLLDRLRMALRRAERDGRTVGVFYLDIDGFKETNIRYGRTTGDLVLKSIAERITRNVRQVDTVGRIGSDEFVVVLEKPGDLAGCVKIAGNLRNKLQRLYDVQGKIVELKVSIGVGQFPDDERNFEDLISLCRRRAREAYEGGGGLSPAASE